MLAFQNYQPFTGFFKSEWVGFEHFRLFLTIPSFYAAQYAVVIVL